MARRELGQASRWEEILRVNPDLDPRRLKPGDSSLLPGAGAPASGEDRAQVGPEPERPRMSGQGPPSRSVPIPPVSEGEGGIPRTPATDAVSAPSASPAGEDASARGETLAVHRIAPWDTLYLLARRYCGDPSRWTLIPDVNPRLRSGGLTQLQLGQEPVVTRVPPPDR